MSKKEIKSNVESFTEAQKIGEKLSNEIISSKDPMNVLYNTLIYLNKKDPFLAYLITRRFSQDIMNLYISDLGYVGLAERALPMIPLFHGDIIIYGASTKLATGEIAEMLFRNTDKNNSIEIRHGKIQNFTNNGLIELKDTSIDYKYVVQRWQVLGKIIKVIKFNTPEWKEIFEKLSVDKNSLTELIKGAIPVIEKSKMKYKEKIIKELKSRLAILSK
jgi:hypothetical protein